MARMKTLYEAANTLEAHMLVELLKQENLSAAIEGGPLQGAAGLLPVAGLVRVVVEESDHAAAREIIARWEADHPAEVAASPSQESGSRLWSGLALGLVLGLLLGVGGSYAWFRSPVQVNGVDYNRDGILDTRWTYSPAGVVLKMEADRNLDGKIDLVMLYDERGLTASSESDDDFNGTFETRTHYRNDSPDWSTVDTDGDGYSDLRYRFESGVLVSMSFINPSTGLPLRVEHYRLGLLQSAELDLDRDGKLDTRHLYGPASELVSTEKIKP
jgi:hypothetical protein